MVKDKYSNATIFLRRCASMLITYENYKKSVRSYLQSELPTSDENKSAIAKNDGTFYLTEKLSENCFYLNWAKSTAEKGIDITELHIKSNYLSQLLGIEHEGSIQESDIDIARLSANISSIHIKVDDLKSIINQTLESCFTNQKHMNDLLATNHVAKYGLHGAVAIKLQNPTAKLLFSTTELSDLGLAISPQQKPIYVFTAIDRPYFIRDEKPIPLSQASNSEQIAIADDKIPVNHSVVYQSQKLFDVSQLNLSKKQQYQLIESYRPQMAEFSEFVEIAKSLRVKIEEKLIVGTAIKGYYDNDKRLAFISSDLSEQQKCYECIKIISEAIVKDTSPSPLEYQELEKNIVSFNLLSRYITSPPNEFINSIANSFVNARNANPEFPIEHTFARTTKMTSHLSKQLDSIMSLRDNSPSQKQDLSQTQRPAHSEELESFIQGI